MPAITREKFLARFPNASPSTLRKNGFAVDGISADLEKTFVAPTKGRLQQRLKPLLNKLEGDFYRYLLNEYRGAYVYIQAKKFKLGNGVWYCPDFTVNLPLTLHEVAFEVKGVYMWDDAGVKLKVAAGMYPNIKWVLVWKDKKHDGWQFQQILS